MSARARREHDLHQGRRLGRRLGARTRHVYCFHVDVAFEGETITFVSLGYAGPVPGSGSS